MLRAVLRDSVIYSLASMLSKGLAVFLVPLYTRVLSTGDYGAYDLLITLGALANLTVAFEISQGLARYWVEAKNRGDRRRLASTALWFTALMYAIFLMVGLLVSPQLTPLLLGSDSYLEAFRVGLGFIAVNGIYYLLLNQFRWELRSKDYTLVSLGCAVLTLTFSILFCLGYDQGLIGVMLAQLLAVSVMSVIGLWLLRGSFGGILDFSDLVSMLRFSVPLVPAGLAVFISLYINRFALNNFGSLADVGLFGIGSRIAGLSSLMLLGIQAALTPLVYQHYRESGTPIHIARLFGWFSAAALFGCLFLGLFARELLVIFATPDFLGGASLVIYLAPAMLLSQMYIFAPGIAIYKKTLWQLWVTVGSAAVSVLSNWLLVPAYGVLGAAIATLLAALVFFGAWLLVSQRLYYVPYAWKGISISLLVFVGCAQIGEMVNKLSDYLILAVICKLLLCLLMAGAVVISRLVPVSDLKLVANRLRRRRA